MQSVSVHIAVLAVGQDAAPTQTVSELATKAGHKIVGRATVSDTEPAIRAQLKRWLDDANVDVVIISGGIESENAGTAVKPTVTQTLPGFTDLFRYLAFQEIGASAMLSNAEAAQCGSTFVFVLPASAGAVRAAMEKLILPQLDPKTTPKNLVTSMPRLKALGDAVPVVIAKEKTASGSGLTPKMPSAPIRARSHTGANVIRKLEPSFDPPTKPIDVAKLEEQIALSENPPHDAATKQVDLSRLPKVPPGADPLSDDTEQVAPGDLPGRNARLDSEPIDPPAPRKVQRTELSAVVPPPRAGGLLPEPPAPRAPVPLPDSGHDPVAPLPAVPAVRSKPATEPPPAPRTKALTGPFAVPAVIPKSPSGPTRKQPTQPSPVVAKRPPTEPPPPPRPRPPTGGAPTVKPAPAAKAAGERAEIQTEEIEKIEPIDALPEAAPPATPPKRPPTQPPPRPPTNPPPTPRATTQPPPKDPDLGELIETPLRRSGELPAGTFSYPVKSGPSKLVLALAGLAVLAVGFAAFVILFPRDQAQVTPSPANPNEVATAPADAALVAIADPEPVSDPELDPDIEMQPSDPDPAPTSTTPTRTTPTRPRTTPTTTATKPPPTDAGSAAAVTKPDLGGTSPAPGDSIDSAPTNPAPAAGDCDEVSCVLAKYDRPCCEKYRPKESGIAPRTADGLPAELDKSMVRAGIDKVKPRVVACGEQSTAKGTVKISVSVKPDGTVGSASVVTTPNTALGDCVATALKKAEFGKSVGGGSFTYPFVF